MTLASRRIAIVGAGIGGLTAALELARLGFRVALHERAARLEEVGAGLQLSPNALRVLDRLGLMPALRARGCEARQVTLRDGRSGRVVAKVPVHAGDGTPYLSIHRADLQGVLAEAVAAEPAIDFRLGSELCGIEPTAGSAVRVTLGQQDGKATGGFEADLLIAADGVHSTIARSLGLPGPVATGAIAWRTQIPATGIAGGAQAEITAWLGPRRHAVSYPVRDRQGINLVLIEPAGDAPDPDPAGLSRRFGGWNATLTRLIAIAERPTFWPLLGIDRGRSWRLLDDRIVLLGDAAHAMLPYAAQGAAMAIEDAAVLAASLATTPSTSAALAAYEAARRPRIDRVRERVDFHRRVYHLRFPLTLGRDAVLSLRSAASLRDDLAWLYDWQPPSA
ncbi:FAD-dependent monooxygenase [Jiella sp. M17.18]|uniref:FAD-dependent monooxygenase n=1 Tax=Jiella sp. M17.18 TaxID=3234247 RepID=UPI0034E03527